MSDQASPKKSALENLQSHLPKVANDLSPMECSAKLGSIIREAREAVLQKGATRPKKGLQTASQLAETTDAAIRGLFDAGSALYSDEAQHMAVVAVGGYGRGTLAQFSDIDILILHGAYASQKIKPLLDFILYALWDAGLTVAQSVHSPASAVAFAKEDLSGNTSFLDAKLLHGNEQIFQDFTRRYHKHRKQTVSAFVEAKLEERELRLTEGRASRYRTEPDVKEGKGGLRDLQTLHWLARYVHGTARLADHVSAGVLTEEELASFQKAREFLWSVRMLLHQIRDRADERLTFDIQPEIARRLGYRGTERAPAAERLMKHYFLTAAEVGRLTGILCANLEEAQIKKPRLRLPSFVGGPAARASDRKNRRVRADEQGSTAAFCMRGDRLDFVDHETLQGRPVDLFRLFRIAGRKPACEIHPDALKTVSLSVNALDKAAIRNPEFTKVFESILLGTEDPEKILRDMAETGLLGRYVPVFGKLVGCMKYGLYRSYTLDEGVLKSVGVLSNILSGKAGRANPVATQVFKRIADPIPLILAVLLHEVTQALAHLSAEAQAKEIRNSLTHLIQDDQTRDDIIWTVMNYRIMADTTARRNVMDPAVVQRFCDTVGNERRLDFLVVVTTCHLSVVGVNALDRWTRRDLTVLFQAAQSMLKGGLSELNRLLNKQQETLRNKTARKLSDWSVPELERFFKRLPRKFFDDVSPETAARFARTMKEVDQSNNQGAAKVTRLDDDRLEVIVYSRDKPGLYAAIAGTIFSLGGIVRASTAFPVSAPHKGPDMAANIFVFCGDEESPLIDGNDELAVVQNIEQRFEETVSGRFDLDLDILPRIGDRRSTFEVPSKVTLDQETSDDALIVEASGLDRPGLLYKLAAALNEVNVSIRSAYIATYGEVAVDTFYVQDLPGYKIEDKRRQEVIKRKLLAVLRSH